MKFEEYLKERFRLWDLNMLEEREAAFDLVTNKVISLLHPEKEISVYQIDRLDKTYAASFIGSYVVCKNFEADEGTLYRILEVNPFDPHNGNILAKCVGKNFKESHKHRCIAFRKGIIKTITKEEIMQIKGWHIPVSESETPRDLYILKNEIGRIKIGQAINVSQRIYSIEMQSGIQLDILNVVKRQAQFESKLHKIFKTKQYRGEWYELNDSEIKWLVYLNEENIAHEILNMKEGKNI